MSTIDTSMKSNWSLFFIFSIHTRISSFLHNPYHGFVVSRVPIHAFTQLKSNTL
ncbi:MAG: hypothetical protein Q8S84_03695 [bacterium]|nr:hypothetical protein [bacterium]MDP3380624.1 hypothetical protein [bacterium]